jgi:hypothetical protein
MKTVTNGTDIRRVGDGEARALVGTGKWFYCAKRNWKNWKSRRIEQSRSADRVDGYDRDDLGESPDF